MKKLEYYHVKPGEKVILRLDNGKCAWTIKCCDCGLEHIVLLAPKHKTIEIGAWRRDDILNMVLPKKPTPNHKSKKLRGA